MSEHKNARVRYWHGGPAGRRVGELLRPPNETGAESADKFATYGEGVYRRDRVYVTTDPSAALMFASGHAEPVVYEVEPIGELEPDPDCDVEGLSFACPAARVIAWRRLTRAQNRIGLAALFSREAP